MSASDGLVWKILSGGSCSYRIRNRINMTYFCTHDMNVDGLCRVEWCPLSNSDYATVIESEGKIHLCLKTVERAHLPGQWWEKIELDPMDTEKSRILIKENIAFKNKKLKMKIQERFVKLCQLVKRIKEVRTDTRVELEQVHKKRERRWNRREKRALAVANLETSIEKELLKRLNSGVYGTLYEELLEREKVENEQLEQVEREVELEVGEEFVAEEENDFEKIEFDVGFDNDIEDILNKYNKRARKKGENDGEDTKKRKIVEKEVEIEIEDQFDVNYEE